MDEDKLLDHLGELAFQGRVISWNDIIDHDMEWNRLTFEGTQEEFYWTVNAINDTLPSAYLEAHYS